MTIVYRFAFHALATMTLSQSDPAATLALLPIAGISVLLILWVAALAAVRAGFAVQQTRVPSWE